MLRFALSLFSYLVCLSVAFYQLTAMAQQTRDEDEVVRVNTDLLLFPVRIRDKKGQAVAGLTEQDLSLKDQDQVTTGDVFFSGRGSCCLMFALDQSGSLRRSSRNSGGCTRSLLAFRRTIERRHSSFFRHCYARRRHLQKISRPQRELL